MAEKKVIENSESNQIAENVVKHEDFVKCTKEYEKKTKHCYCLQIRLHTPPQV